MRAFYRTLIVFFLILYPELCKSALNVKEFRNGLNAVIFEDRTSPVISLQLWISAGSTSETDDEAGYAHFLEHLTFRSKDIARRIEILGGDINAYTSLEKTVYHLTIPKEHLEEGLKVLADIFYSTEFTEESFNAEKDVILEEMKRGYDSPERVLYKTFFESAIKDHPARRPVIGYEENIKQATPVKLYDFYNKFYIPEKSFIVAAGDLESHKVTEFIENIFSRNKKSDSLKKDITRTDISFQPGIFIKEKDIKSCYIMVGFPTPNIYSKDVPVIDVLSYLYGESSTSLLNEELKEKKQLVSYIYSYQFSLTDLGFFIIQANFPCKNTEQVVEEIGKALFTSSFTVEESSLKKVLKNYEANYYFSREKYNDIARDMGSSFLYFKDPNYSRKYIELIRSVSRKDLLRARERFIKPEKMTLVVLTPERSDKNLLIDNLNRIVDSYKSQERTFSQITLKNGLKIVVQKRTGQPTFAFNLAGLAGQRLEEKAGLSYLTASSFLRGTKNRSYKNIIEEIELIGGSINAYSTKNMTGVSGQFLKEDFERAISLLSEILREFNPKKEEVDKVKRLILEEIKRKKERPTSLLRDIYFSNIFNGTNFANPTEGTEETINSIDQEELTKAFYNIFSPDRLFMTISGDLPDGYEEILKKHLETIPTRQTTAVRNIQPRALKKELIESSQFNQSHILVGFIIPSVYSPLRANFHILSNILSNQSGRLFVNLRDKKGLAYSLGAFIFEFPEFSLLNLYIGTSPEKTETARKGLIEELENLVREGVGEEEILKAKNQIIFSFAESLQKNSDVASTYVQNYILFNNPLHYTKFQEEIKKINSKNLIEPLKDYLKPEKAIIVILQGKS